MSPLLLLMIIGLPLASQAVANAMQTRFVRFSQDPMPFTGAETALRMLHENGIYDVKVVPTGGKLTDHYDPTAKIVALSEVVYARANVAACAVAAHECGHAVQHATGYPMLGLRTLMIPLLNFSNRAMPALSIGGAMLSSSNGLPVLAYALIATLCVPALFSLITLPVEFNASNRALRWMEKSGITTPTNHDGAQKALWWAAMTYVVAALGSIAQVIFWAQRLLHRRR